MAPAQRAFSSACSGGSATRKAIFSWGVACVQEWCKALRAKYGCSRASIFLCSGVAYVFWYDALERLPAWRVGAFLYLEPLITVAVAAALLREVVRAGTMIGGAITLFGLWLVNRKRAG